MKAETWLRLAIKPEEVERTPNDVLADSRDVEEEAASLYEGTRPNLEHTGKDFNDYHVLDKRICFDQSWLNLEYISFIQSLRSLVFAIKSRD